MCEMQECMTGTNHLLGEPVRWCACITHCCWMHLPAQLSLLNCHVLSKRDRTCIRAYLVLFLSLKCCYGWGFCVFASTFFFVINHPNNFNSVKSKNSVNSQVLHFVVASESLRHWQFCSGAFWASVQIKQCYNCWWNQCSLLMITENLYDCVQQHSSFHLSLAANSVVFYAINTVWKFPGCVCAICSAYIQS